MKKCNRLISHLAFPIDNRLFQLIVPPLTGTINIIMPFENPSAHTNFVDVGLL